MWRPYLLYFLILGLLGAFSIAQAQPLPKGVTQRRINEWAAEMEKVRVTLVEGTGLRQPNETLPAYLERLSKPLPNESASIYRTRLEGYLTLFTEVADTTVGARRMPSLQNSFTANRQVWERLVRRMNYLPGRVNKLRLAWERLRTQSDTKNVFTQELVQTVQLTQALLDELRLAQP